MLLFPYKRSKVILHKDNPSISVSVITHLNTLVLVLVILYLFIYIHICSHFRNFKPIRKLIKKMANGNFTFRIKIIYKQRF